MGVEWKFFLTYISHKHTSDQPWDIRQRVYITNTFFPGGSVGKESACNAGDPSSIPGLGRSPGKGISYPLQCKEIEEYNRMGKTRDLFKKTRDTKETFYAKTGIIKDRNGMDLIEAGKHEAKSNPLWLYSASEK